jgi:hypothetical protein
MLNFSWNSCCLAIVRIWNHLLYELCSLPYVKDSGICVEDRLSPHPFSLRMGTDPVSKMQ